MRAGRPAWAVCRAVIAVTVLYAFALQALMAGIGGIRTFDPAHLLCLQETGAPEAPQKVPPHGHPACCPASHAAPSSAAPVPVAVPVVWPSRRTVRAVWPPEIVAAPRAPPGVSASARAPPVV